MIACSAVSFVLLDIAAGAVWAASANPALVVVAVLITVPGSNYFQGMVGSFLDARGKGENVGLWASITGVPFVRLSALDLCVTPVIVAGLTLLVVPGLVVMARTAFTSFLLTSQRCSIGTSLGASAFLVRTAFRTVIVLVTVSFALFVGVAAGALLVVHVLFGNSFVASWLAALMANVVVAPPATIALYLVFERVSSSSEVC